MVKVLYVEDEPLQRELVNQLLQLAVSNQLAENGLKGSKRPRNGFRMWCSWTSACLG